MGRLRNYLQSIPAKEFRSAIRKRTALPGWKVKLKLTTRCNLRCAKCNLWRTMTPDRISEAEALEIIRQIARSGARFIKFSGGEVTLRADLPNLIRAAKRKGLETSITTNGTLIDRELAKTLVKAGLDQVNISLDAADAATHDALVGVAGAWKKTLAAFEHIRRRRRGARPRVVLQAVVCTGNQGAVLDLARLAVDAGADSLSLLGFVPYHLVDQEIALEDAEIAKFIAVELAEVESYCAEFGLSLANTGYNSDCLTEVPYFARNACYIPWISYYIAPDGDVYPCCFTKQRPYRLGNVLKDRLTTILDGPAYRAFREKTSPVCVEETCRRCRTEIRTNQQIERWLAGER